MPEQKTSSFHTSSSPDMVVACLYIMAGLCAVCGALGAFWIILRGNSAENSSLVSIWMSGLGVLVIGFAGATMFWAMGWIVKQRHITLIEQQKLLQRITSALQTPLGDPHLPPPPSQSTPDITTLTSKSQSDLHKKLLDQILNQLTQLNTNVLLSSDQRTEKYQQVQENIIDQLSQQITDAIESEQFEDAEALTKRLADYADKSLVEVCRGKITDARQKIMQLLVEEQSQRLADLMAVSRFDEAVDLAKDLHGKFPSTPEVNTLLERVKREAQTFTQEQCHRLYAEIQSAGEARHWKAALTAAHKLMEEFPDSPQAKQTRAIMPTIVDNTRIEEVRELRTRIIDMMERRRYADALEMANHVIENYPETAAADELRNQIAHLRERSKTSQGEESG
jgi:tetratricopeptide (TPR) repeat protein